MNKKDLIDWVALNTGETRVLAEKIVNATLAGIQEGTRQNGSVTLVGFGVFKASPRKARTGKNPATGEAIEIAASVAPKFSAGKAFKDALNPAV